MRSSIVNGCASGGVTTSVCTGSMLVGAAGILQGKRATSRWAVRDYLRNFGAEPVAERVVIEGKVITAGGVSAVIDMALTLAAREAAEDEARALHLVIEYDPQPPYDSDRWRRLNRRPSSAQPNSSHRVWYEDDPSKFQRRPQSRGAAPPRPASARRRAVSGLAGRGRDRRGGGVDANGLPAGAAGHPRPE